MYPEIVAAGGPEAGLPPERSSAIVGRRLLDVFGWQLGQNVTLQGTIFPGDWTFTIRGVYTPSDPVINDDMMLFHHEYLDERIGRGRDSPGGTSCEIDDPEQRRRDRQDASTTSSGTRARPPRPAPSRRSTPASPRCGAT